MIPARGTYVCAADTNLGLQLTGIFAYRLAGCGGARDRSGRLRPTGTSGRAGHAAVSAPTPPPLWQGVIVAAATLVARGVPPSEVFSAVVAELASCLDSRNASLFRYEPDGTALLLAAADEPGLQKMPVGERFSLDGDNVAAMVRRSGRAARMGSHDHAAGAAAARIRALGLCSAVGAPIVVDNRVWGVAVAGSSRPDAFPPSAEQRVSDFADLIAIAIANVQARAELTASRARIVAAADDTRGAYRTGSA